jgi:hypothetical protein
MLKQARNAELEQRRLEELNRSIATGIAAAQGAGGRAVVGALPGMIRASDAGALDILGQRQDQTMQALGFAAKGAENEIERKMYREMIERQAAQAAIDSGLQNIAGAVGQIGAAAIYGGQDKPEERDEASRQKMDFTLAPPPKALARVSSSQSLPSAGSMVKRSSPIPSLAGLKNLNPALIMRSIFEEGGMVTGGKFDHKANPIDIVKKGQKIGEMTGGEVILNPAQQQKLSKESAYFRQLLKKFNKQK